MENNKYLHINSTKKKTFFFEKFELYPILNDNKKFSIPNLSDKLKLIIKSVNFLIPKLNFDISNKIKKEYLFLLKKKKDNKVITKLVENEKIENDENLEFVGCDFILMGEKIVSVDNLN